jgi:hypothetical protein
MNPESRLRTLIGQRVKVIGIIRRYERRIDELRKEKRKYDDMLRRIQKEMTQERKKVRHFWWWPWGG